MVRYILSFFLPAALVVLSIPTVFTASNINSCANRVKACDPTEDYFETKINFKFASTVSSLEYNNTFVKLQFKWNDYNGPNQEASYVLVRCGCPDPVGLDAKYKRIFVPVSSAFVQQTVTVPKVYLLGQREKLLGKYNIVNVILMIFLI